MSHLFTQWGAKFTPTIEVLVNGKKVKKFGWHISSRSEEYEEFLKQLLPELDKVLKRLQIQNETYFHISDEPSSEEDFLLHPFYSEKLSDDYKLKLVKNGLFDESELDKVKTENDYTFGSLFMTK